MPGFLQEIKRRNVFKVALVYAVAGWLTMQVVDVMFPALQLPEWLTTAIAALLLIGFPFALIFAWAFELTPEGIKREKDVDRSASITHRTGKKLNRTIIVILVVALGFMVFDRFMLQMRDEQPAAASAPTDLKPSVAVLPFVNMSGDVENEYFSDGLSEELLNVLAKIPALHVAGRTSSFQFKGENQDLREIGEKLNVANVLEGSVRQSGARLRITAQLIDAGTGYHLWSETYDREITDVFAIQDEIAASVVDALRVTLLGESASSIDHGTGNLAAYNLFLQALHLADRTTEADMQRAAQALHKAIELDPDYAQAWAKLARVHELIASGFVGPGTGDFRAEFDKVNTYADKALSLGPDVADSYIAKGQAMSRVSWQHDEAHRFYARAVEIAPNDVEAIGNLAFSWMSRKRFDEAIALSEKMLRLDPLSITAHRTLGDVYSAAGRIDDAMAVFEKALVLQPDTARINGRMARIHTLRGEWNEAAERAAQEPVEWVREFYDVILVSRGTNTAALQAAAKAYEQKYGLANSYQLAEIYAFSGDVDNAIKWLEESHDIHDPGMMWLQTSSYLARIEDDPRWPRMVKLAGF